MTTLRDLINQNKLPLGLDTPVLGELKLTNDGAIACEEGECYCIYRIYDDVGSWKISPCRRSGNPEDYGCWWQVDECEYESCTISSVWATREMAELALNIMYRIEKENK